eukprot:gene1916-biopygen1740
MESSSKESKERSSKSDVEESLLLTMLPDSEIKERDIHHISRNYGRIVSILGNTLHESIVASIKEAKYYSITVDATPDVAHVDQLVLVVSLKSYISELRSEGKFKEYLEKAKSFSDTTYQEFRDERRRKTKSKKRTDDR